MIRVCVRIDRLRSLVSQIIFLPKRGTNRTSIVPCVWLPRHSDFFCQKEVQYLYRNLRLRSSSFRKRFCQKEVQYLYHTLRLGSSSFRKSLCQKEVQYLYRTLRLGSSSLRKRFGQKEVQYLYHTLHLGSSRFRFIFAKKRYSTSIVPCFWVENGTALIPAAPVAQDG